MSYGQLFRWGKFVNVVPFAPVPECGCPSGRCWPEDNEGCYCWLSNHTIPEGYFTARAADAVKPAATPRTEGENGGP